MGMRYPEFAKRFKLACERANMPKSGEALGKKLGVSSTMIYNYRNGEKLPSTETLGDISKLLNISIDWLINGREPISQEEMRLIELYRASPEPAKRMINSVAESAASYSVGDNLEQDAG